MYYATDPALLNLYFEKPVTPGYAPLFLPPPALVIL